MTNSTEASDLVARLKLLADWRRPGGKTPTEPKPVDYKTCDEAAAYIAASIERERRLREVLFLSTGDDVSLNLQGCLYDLRNKFDPKDGGVIANTIGRVIDQIEAARAALAQDEGAVG